MLNYLLKRPIAVFTISLALVILGIAASFNINTSLMPDIPVPKITVQVDYPNTNARQLETNVIRPLRNQLLQVNQLKDIHSRTSDGFAVIQLDFSYGTDTDYAFIEANEMVDAAMNRMPRDLKRPRVIKASATDIPVLRLSIFNKGNSTSSDFLELSDFTQSVIKRKIEQLPEIALADMSGHLFPEVKVTPKQNKIQALGIDQEQLINAIQQNNINLSNLIVQDGIYQYNFEFDAPLQNAADIKAINLNINDQLYQLEDLARISLVPEQMQGSTAYNDKKAIELAIIKQADASLYQLKDQLDRLVDQLQVTYPELVFKKHQDQGQLLQVSINNLRSSLIISSLLAIIIMFLFIKDRRLPFIIGISIPSSLIISVLLMYILGLTINIISLSGLILGVGMMIDNAIIVIDNITQKLMAGDTLLQACAKGSEEIITPLLSSVFTTCAVFFPLVFISGITGALFYDQAVAVAIGLMASLLSAVILIPLIYYQMKKSSKQKEHFPTRLWLDQLYEKGYRLFVDQKYYTVFLALLFLGMGIFLSLKLPVSNLPQIKQDEAVLAIDWNDNINVQANQERCVDLLKNEQNLEKYVIEAGRQDFLLNDDPVQSFETARIYIKAESPEKLINAKQKITTKLAQYQEATYKFTSAENIFQYIFQSDEPEFMAKVVANDQIEIPSPSQTAAIKKSISFDNQEIPTQKVLNVNILHERLLQYKISYNQLIQTIRSILDRNIITTLKNTRRQIPVRVGSSDQQVQQLINDRFITNADGLMIPVKQLITLTQKNQYKVIHADNAGEYLPFYPAQNNIDYKAEIEKTQTNFTHNDLLSVKFDGEYFNKSAVIKEILLVISISLLLLYLIMAAQFNSLKQPLIILIEIPIDIGGALLLLYIFGSTINIMAGIGIVVMSGIVINDSILKIHTMNQLLRNGVAKKEAIKQGSKMRLKPIIMTSLTTILALVPFLIIDGLGADLQKSLALSVIGGLVVGTFMSLYLIPIVYNWLTHEKTKF